MKLVPRHNQIIGRIVIKRSRTTILRPDETKNISKFVLVDAVGLEAAAAGIKVGDVILPTNIANIFLDGGTNFRPLVEEKNVAAVVRDFDLAGEFIVQSESGARFVGFDHEEAAKSMAESEQAPPLTRSVAA